jgi:archaellum component FlaG (FlaF/FlaG flagellin family)
MKNRIFLLIIFISLTMIIGHVSAEEKIENKKQGPVAVVSNPRFEAAPVIEGNDITHNFVIKNAGADTLKISRVKTG